MTQNKTILQHLKKKKSITTWEAIANYRITRLAARISDLRHKLGYKIKSTIVTKDGKTFAKYELIT